MGKLIFAAVILAFAVAIAGASHTYRSGQVVWCAENSAWNGMVLVGSDSALGSDSYNGHVLAPGLFARKGTSDTGRDVTAGNEGPIRNFECTGWNSTKQ